LLQRSGHGVHEKAWIRAQIHQIRPALAFLRLNFLPFDSSGPAAGTLSGTIRLGVKTGGLVSAG
jgi:hypothetical protein